jgi:hypothetical protein
VQLEVSAYDRAASLLVALLVLVGFFVILLFLIWLTNRVFATQLTVPVEFLDEMAGSPDAALGAGRDFEEPGVEELQNLAEPSVQDVLAAVSETVSAQAAATEGFLDATAQGHGVGDRRSPGTGGSDIVPRWQRWEIRFASTSPDGYARQLDHFGIELAAVGGSATIDYAHNLGQPVPQRRSGRGDEEKRLYMTWRSGRLQDIDRELLDRAGVATQGRLVVQFYPPQVEQTLARLERERAGRRSLKEIRKTVFGVRSGGRGYDFYVIDQEYRGP